ncbi:Mariner Mos1 transposase [Eumeta japonica]|uniref:Mariner Mos1 transposase n=1 Tax=Eumeta variegata TaxID=151549 RepID=A0A4C2AH77_EUMVA|nr:Mariner Mos1 transposase [Eumeta japonica]
MDTTLLVAVIAGSETLSGSSNFSSSAELAALKLIVSHLAKSGNTTPPAVFTNIVPSDYHLFRAMAHGLSEQQFISYEDTENWVD